ncbi:Uu.00g131510.m01.CDS01 [Anthostomella pinea]|uniref:Uu.00g131510.m01.CDS01 n=1 Tax=Anthostomella pinea TaxID=933095 RepID=A0AAI8VIZ3_9PEZI|nr:Uu.00g131510.m01.CDS01 [Anthostomella pinea]
MDPRNAIPVTLPRDKPTQSYWQLEPDEIADLRSTESLPSDADVVIIGSGITGAAVAYNLLSNGAQNVVMLEARQACSGATGRNGGHTKAASYRSFLQHQQDHGTATAVKIARLELANIRAVHTFAREHGLDCDSNPCGTVDVIYDAKQWEADQRAVKAMQAAMPGDDASVYTLHSAEEVREKFYCGKGGNEAVSGGISYEAGSLSAYKLGSGILKLDLQKGLNLQTNTPALSLNKVDDSGRWQVETPRGTVTTKRVVAATNGYTAHLLKRFQGVIVPLRGHVTAQRPGQNMPKEGLPATYSFIYENGYDYMIQRAKGPQFEGDIVIGGSLTAAPADGLEEYGTTDDTGFDEVIVQTLNTTLPEYFGESWGEDHPDGRVRKTWTGIMGYSPDGFPFVGEMPGEEDLWISCSFQGHGMVLCWMCARALVAMMEGHDNQELDSWFPEAFRVSEKRLALSFRGRLHTGAEPSPYDS